MFCNMLLERFCLVIFLIIRAGTNFTTFIMFAIGTNIKKTSKMMSFSQKTNMFFNDPATKYSGLVFFNTEPQKSSQNKPQKILKIPQKSHRNPTEIPKSQKNFPLISYNSYSFFALELYLKDSCMLGSF